MEGGLKRDFAMVKRDNTYTTNLIEPIVRASVSDRWETAVLEWDISDCEEDESAKTDCMCGHEGIRYLFYIRNRNNGTTFGPIGSECIKKFGRKDLASDVDVQERMFKLYEAITKGLRIELNTTLFSRKFLLYLCEQGAIDERDYEFMLEMFNKRDKDAITFRQQSKINAVLGFSIKPFLQQRLAAKRK